MMRLIAVGSALAFTLLTGCAVGNAYLHHSAFTNARYRQYVCIDGVEYISSATSQEGGWNLTPHFKPDGTLFTAPARLPARTGAHRTAPDADAPIRFPGP